MASTSTPILGGHFRRGSVAMDAAARLRESGSVYGKLPYETAEFDLVLCFSVFEHLHQYERGSARSRACSAGAGVFLLGMPAVNTMMEVGFRAIGFIRLSTKVTSPRRALWRERFLSRPLAGDGHARPRLLPGLPLWLQLAARKVRLMSAPR